MSSKKNESIVIYFDRPRGGFGDIACNVIMARKLREVWPEAEIKIVYCSAAAHSLKILLPSLLLEEGRQTVDGFEFIQEKSDLVPRADAYLSFATFAASSLFHDSSPRNQTPLRLGYYELSAMGNPVVTTPVPGHEMLARPELNRRAMVSNSQVDPSDLPESHSWRMTLHSGADSSGLYISPKRPCEPMSFKALRERLKAELHLSDEQVDWLDSDCHVAFAYTKLMAAEELYASALVQARGSEKTKLLVFLKKFEGIQLPAAPNVQFVLYDSLSFDTSMALLYHSNPPPLVTGDVSLSMAVDFEKPFFYEMTLWKFNCAEALSSVLKNTPAMKQNREWSSALERILMIDSKYPMLDSNEMAEIISDKMFLAGFTEAISQVREKQCLPLMVKKHLRLLWSLDLERLNSTELSFLVKEQHRTSATGPESLKEIFEDRSRLAHERILAFGALLSTSDWDRDDNIKSCERLFAEKDPRVQFVLQSYLLFNLNKDPKVSALFERMLMSPNQVAHRVATKILLAGIAGTYSPEESGMISPDLAKRLLRQHSDIVQGTVEALMTKKFSPDFWK
jgi:hypothetical protein